MVKVEILDSITLNTPQGTLILTKKIITKSKGEITNTCRFAESAETTSQLAGMGTPPAGAKLKPPLSPEELLDFKNKILESHNKFRAIHSAKPLTIDDELSKVSQEWAEHLALMGKMFHRPKCIYGENIFMTSEEKASPTQAVQVWYDEIKTYNFDEEVNDPKLGHFTQLVWQDSSALGIGVASGDNGALVVTNYNPPGNMKGLYRQNVLKNIKDK